MSGKRTFPVAKEQFKIVIIIVILKHSCIYRLILNDKLVSCALKINVTNVFVFFQIFFFFKSYHAEGNDSQSSAGKNRSSSVTVGAFPMLLVLAFLASGKLSMMLYLDLCKYQLKPVCVLKK